VRRGIPLGPSTPRSAWLAAKTILVVVATLLGALLVTVIGVAWLLIGWWAVLYGGLLCGMSVWLRVRRERLERGHW
jgi:hypothetical protein